MFHINKFRLGKGFRLDGNVERCFGFPNSIYNKTDFATLRSPATVRSFTILPFLANDVFQAHDNNFLENGFGFSEQAVALARGDLLLPPPPPPLTPLFSSDEWVVRWQTVCACLSNCLHTKQQQK